MRLRIKSREFRDCNLPRNLLKLPDNKIRNDRFCVGAFLDALEHGVMREILLRLKVIATDESLL